MVPMAILSMPVDDLLTQYPGSFFVLNHQVSRVRFSEKHSDDRTVRRVRMTVESEGAKYRFDVSHVPGSRIARRLGRRLPHAVQ